MPSGKYQGRSDREPPVATNAEDVGAPRAVPVLGASVALVPRRGTLTHSLFGCMTYAGILVRQLPLPVAYASWPALAVWVLSQ
jgi:hypothetical protein